MKVKANKPLLYKRTIYETNEVFEIDEVSYTTFKSYGWISDAGSVDETDLINIDEGLPALDDEPKRKKKWISKTV